MILAYATFDDWAGDAHQHRFEPHWRLMIRPSDNTAAAVCVQDFDYVDTDARRILSPDAWNTEQEAHEALLALLPAIIDAKEKFGGTVLAPDVLACTLAAIVRGDRPSMAAMARPAPSGARRPPPGPEAGEGLREGLDAVFVPLTEELLDRLVAGERVVIDIPPDPVHGNPDDLPLAVVLSWVASGSDSRPRRGSA